MVRLRHRGGAIWGPLPYQKDVCLRSVRLREEGAIMEHRRKYAIGCRCRCLFYIRFVTIRLAKVMYSCRMSLLTEFSSVHFTVKLFLLQFSVLQSFTSSPSVHLRFRLYCILLLTHKLARNSLSINSLGSQCFAPRGRICASITTKSTAANCSCGNSWLFLQSLITSLVENGLKGQQSVDDRLASLTWTH